MFYGPSIGESLRMGDVVRGFILGAAHQEFPKIEPHNFRVNLRSPQFSVILTPCCSIGDKTLALAPLVQINCKWLENPYFRDDLTNINREMNPEQSIPLEVWNHLSEDEKQRRLNNGKAFALVEWYIYPPHDVLGSYKVKRENSDIEIGYYAVDFRSIYKVECTAVVNTKQAPITAKVLELSISARAELRNKLSDYFGRIPDEDKI